MINKKLYQDEFIREAQKEFVEAIPFKYVIIDQFLNDSAATQLSNYFPSLSQMNISYNGINEKKAEHSNFSELNKLFTQLREELFDQSFIELIQKITGLEHLHLIQDRYGYGLHQGGQGSFLDIHIDYNLHLTEKKQRRLNLLLFLSDHWENAWGGQLQFWNSDVTRCIQNIMPRFNRCVIFECNEVSYHGYDLITCPPNITRKSFYLYFFSVPTNKLSFHDTVFTPTPQDSKLKRYKVQLKETLKNKVKKIIYDLGLTRFFK
jgi:Rps23 Pro-64 3,4-dihydroxylase Tpa1-like proline 4-hydroxylase